MIKHFISFFILCYLCFPLLFSNQNSADAQIGRNSLRKGGDGDYYSSRTSSKIRNQTFQEEEDNNTSEEDGFHVYSFYKCESEKLLYEIDIEKRVKDSYINSNKIRNNPLLFSLVIEIIKAHMEIASKTYSMYGLDVNSTNFNLRYHDKDMDKGSKELKLYRNRNKDIAANINQQAKIFLPDAVRSIAYIDYVITPTIKPFIDSKTEELKIYERIMKHLSFIDVLSYEKERHIWHYKDFLKYKEIFYKLLDIIEERNLKRMGYSRKDSKFEKKIILEMVKMNIISYDIVRACPIITLPQDTQFDLNDLSVYEIPASRDNFLMGLGLFARAKSLFQSYTEKKEDDIKNIVYFNFFSEYYKDIFTPEYDGIFHSDLQKSYLEIACFLSDNEEKECDLKRKKTYSKERVSFENLR